MGHDFGLKYKMVVVVASCRRDMVPDLIYKMVVVAPCRSDIVMFSTMRWCWLSPA